ncbi:ATP-dependent helicase [Acuticoccus sp.]|uniref:ATP-dependent helicase n=1 Tax=Acuticoccus sp. TaxID=1904378 RepID=UPI003B52AB89
MTDNPLEPAFAKLTDIQREAVAWGDGAMLVLAGPGSGKTQVLTCRIARLLDAGRDQSFRILALTFTNKAADEMKERVATFVPGLEGRANIGTFHSFCGQVLRQHGIHLGIKPDFAIYSQDDDRKAVLEDALKRADMDAEGVRYLGLIDRMKTKLIEPKDAASRITRAADPQSIAQAYEAYESELRRLNVLDFNSLIFEAFRLFSTFPAIAVRYRRSYPYWLLDEFQDTNDAQYRLIRTVAGDEFKNVFAVADDDQIIYQWNGASFRQIQRFRADFQPQLIQLPTNYRCPPAIVAAANRLVAYNVQRTDAKKPLVAGKTDLKLPEQEHIQLRAFESDEIEAEKIAEEIAAHGKDQWSQITVLARTRALLEKMQRALQAVQVPAVIAQRRDDFLSAEVRWLVACLIQTVRPLDRRNMAALIAAFNRFAEVQIAVGQVLSDAEASGVAYLSTWITAANFEIDASSPHAKLLEAAARLDSASARTIIDTVLAELDARASGDDPDSDLVEDLAAWREISGDIARHFGRNISLDEFLQQLQLRSKAPSPQAHTVTLMTVHGTKGREFDFVYLIGLAEDILPSFQSRQKGDTSPEMEEERRNCFVAITRAKESLILSRAKTYRGWNKQPSRFLVEMGLAHPNG